MPNRMPILDSIVWLFHRQLANNETEKVQYDISIEGTINSNKYLYKVYCMEKQIFESTPRMTRSKSPFKNIDDSSEDEVRALSITLDYFNGEVDDKQSENYLLTDQFRLVRNKENEPLFKSRMVTPVDHRVQPISARYLSNTILSGDKNNIIELLQKFDKNIEGIEVLSPDGRSPIPFFKHKLMGFAPVSVFGDGVRRVLSIASAVLQCRNGVLLIDEIETAIHAKLFERFFGWLVSLCKEYNVQLFATTHSLETIDAILAADKESLEDLMAYRLEASEDATYVKKFSGQDLFDLRYELGQDVR
jgi:AAA15 family ATPase/GTPase